MTLRQGTYRFVVVTERWAYKVPRFRYWGAFLGGMLMNAGEALRWRMSGERERLCPIRFALPGGWLVVMPACAPVRVDEMSAEERRYFAEVLRIEMRDPNFGRLRDGRIVAIDYPRQSDVVYDADGERDAQVLERAAAAVHDVREPELRAEHERA